MKLILSLIGAITVNLLLLIPGNNSALLQNIASVIYEDNQSKLFNMVFPFSCSDFSDTIDSGL